MTIRSCALLVLITTAASLGCASQQSIVAPVAPIDSDLTTNAQASAPTTAAPAPSTRARALPFKGRVTEGDASDLPPAVAMSLSDSSPVIFSYREELTHDEHHLPLATSWMDPVALAGGPVGDFGANASASLSIVEHDEVLADYTATAYVSKTYTLYGHPTHRELDDAARAAVREKIDQQLYRDADRLARAVASAGHSSASALPE
jgi:hypothetical protein